MDVGGKYSCNSIQLHTHLYIFTFKGQTFILFLHIAPRALKGMFFSSFKLFYSMMIVRVQENENTDLVVELFRSNRIFMKYYVFLKT